MTFNKTYLKQPNVLSSDYNIYKTSEIIYNDTQSCTGKTDDIDAIVLVYPEGYIIPEFHLIPDVRQSWLFGFQKDITDISCNFKFQCTS